MVYITFTEEGKDINNEDFFRYLIIALSFETEKEADDFIRTELKKKSSELSKMWEKELADIPFWIESSNDWTALQERVRKETEKILGRKAERAGSGFR